MNEVLKVLLVFLPVIFVAAQIRTLRRLRKIKKNKEGLPGKLNLEGLEGLCTFLYCCGEATSNLPSDMGPNPSAGVDDEKAEQAIRAQKIEMRESERAKMKAEMG